jgi:hypothetical protein
MFMLSSRDLIRRWYGQVKAQPPRVAQSLSNLAAHTVIPDLDQSVFGLSDFVPPQRVLDLVLTSEVNTAGDVVALLVKAYRSSYDPSTNTFEVGGPSNFKLIKDLKLRPIRKGGKGLEFGADEQAGMLLAAYEMDAEREAALRRNALLKVPGARFAGALLSFIEEYAPEFEVTPGLKELAWASLQPGGPPVRTMCVPQGYEGKVKRVVNAVTHGTKLVELEDRPEFAENSERLCFEIPWGNVLVSQGEHVMQGKPVASFSLSERELYPIRCSSKSIDDLWEGIEMYIGADNARKFLRTLWDGEVFQWGKLKMAPHCILSSQQAAKTCGVWRDLRGSLGRVCHFNRDPHQIIRTGRREGAITVWKLQNGLPSYTDLSFMVLGGPVDLYTMPATMVAAVPNSGQVLAVTDD